MKQDELHCGIKGTRPTIQRVGSTQRIASNETGIPLAQWLALFIGAAIVVGLAALFGLRHWWPRYVVTSAISVLIASLLVVTFELQFPFRQQDTACKTFSRLENHIEQMEKMAKREQHTPMNRASQKDASATCREFLSSSLGKDHKDELNALLKRVAAT